MLSNETLDGLGDRLKQLNLIWAMSRGVDLGEYTWCLGKIKYIILREVFVREIADNQNRTLADLVQIAKEACSLCFSATVEQAEKIIEDLLWSKSKSFAQFSFEDNFYDDKNASWEKQRFQFFSLDRDCSDLENGREVYKLSDDALNIVVSNREFENALDVTMEQMIAEMMIKKGNLRDARSTLDMLDVKVRRLIQEEKEHQKQLRRDPKKALHEHRLRWNKNLNEIESQFEEEKLGYGRLISALDKIDYTNDSERKKEVHKLRSRVQRTSRLHDFLAKIVIYNIQHDFEIRSKFFASVFWAPPRKLFKDTLWHSALEVGFTHPDALFYIASSMFSPQKPFVFPIEWIAMEQIPWLREVEFDDGEEDQTAIIPMDINWRKVIQLWLPLIEILIEYGEISTFYYQSIDEKEIRDWLSCKEAFDLWILFKMDELNSFVLTEEILMQDNPDPRILLFQKLIEAYPHLRVILNQTIYVHAETGHVIDIHGEIAVSPIFMKIA